MKNSNSIALISLALSLATPAAGAQALEVHVPPIALASSQNSTEDLSKYFVSEKFDGARAWWNGSHFISRGGNIYHAPSWFTESLPAQTLDGELWIGRGQFQQLMRIIRDTTPDDTAWRSVRFLVFDLPEYEGDFEARQTQLTSILSMVQLSHVEQVSQHRVKTNHDLKSMLEKTVANGGEGLILQRADIPYRAGRHDGMIKLKPHQDAEATVIGFVPGKGKYRGMTGSLIVMNRQGKRFKLGSGLSDLERRNPPSIGTKVTYRYQGLTDSGKPRFAVFLRSRPDE